MIKWSGIWENDQKQKLNLKKRESEARSCFKILENSKLRKITLNPIVKAEHRPRRTRRWIFNFIISRFQGIAGFFPFLSSGEQRFIIGLVFFWIGQIVREGFEKFLRIWFIQCVIDKWRKSFFTWSLFRHFDFETLTAPPTSLSGIVLISS